METHLMNAIAGTYSDLKIVRTRRVVQVVVEIALERLPEFVEKFGAPQPGKEVPVAIVSEAIMGALRLETRSEADDPVLSERQTSVRRDGGALESGEEAPGPVPSASAPPATHKRMTTSQRAWLLCERADFQRWLGVYGAEGAAERMRVICNMSSRSQLDFNPSARSRYDTLTADFEAWQREQA